MRRITRHLLSLSPANAGEFLGKTKPARRAAMAATIAIALSGCMSAFDEVRAPPPIRRN